MNTGLAEYQDSMMLLAFVFIGLALGLVAVVFSVMLFVTLSRRLCMRRLEYRRYFREKGVFEGEETELIEEFTNHSFLPMFVVDVETHVSSWIKMKGCQTDDGLTQCFISRFFVMPFTRIRRVHKVSCLKRGYYKFESAKITFAKVEVYLDSGSEIYVYPRELSINEMKMINSYMQYSAVSKLPLIEDNFSFAGVRKYVHGDSLSAINYKQTARQRELMVNDREYMLGRKVMIYLNFQPNEKVHLSAAEFSNLLEKELSCASFLLSECVRKGYAYSFSANSKMTGGENLVRTGFTIGEKNYEEILCQMAQMTDRYGISAASMIDEDIMEFLSGAEIFLFTAYMDEALELRMSELEKTGNAVNIINLIDN